MGGGVYLLPRGVTDPAAAEVALQSMGGAQGGHLKENGKVKVEILCLVDNDNGELDLDSPEYADFMLLNWSCKQLPQNKIEYYKLLQEAEFVIVLPHLSLNQSKRSLDVRHPYWIYDAMLCGSIPVLGHWVADTVIRLLTHSSAPIVSVAKGEWRTLREASRISCIQALRDKYRMYAASKEPRGLSIALLFFPFWLDKLADMSHVGLVAPASLLDEYNQKGKNIPNRITPHHRARQHQQQQVMGNKHKQRVPTTASALTFDSSRVECSPGIWRPHVGSAAGVVSGSSAHSRISFEVEIVIPRCCEPVEELEWLQKLLQSNMLFKATIYYRCPFCLPQSKGIEWLQFINLNSNLQDKIFMAGGGVIIDDFGNDVNAAHHRIKQFPLFDIRSNGKEFVPYLHHIVYTYNTLADFTVFLHTTPFDHIKTSPIFDTSLQYLAKCKPNGALNSAFWFVNQRMFEGNFWSNCHGCTECLYHYWVSFINANITLSEFVDLPKRAYNAAQFIVSKRNVLSRPVLWWDRLLAVTNSSHQDVSKCPLPRHWNDGDNKAGLALERMWHVIFNRPPLLPFRREDKTLPLALRIE